MYERFDRSMGSSRGLLWAVIVIAVLALGALLLWSRFERRAPQQPAAALPAAVPAPAARQNEPLPVRLFYPASGMLLVEQAGIPRHYDVQIQAREAVAALLASQRAAQVPVMREVRLRALFLDRSGTAYVDLAPAAPDREARGSAWDEFLAVLALVNTLTQNFEEIKQVRFLVDGKEAQTLAGHLDLSVFFRARTDLVRQ